MNLYIICTYKFIHTSMKRLEKLLNDNAHCRLDYGLCLMAYGFGFGFGSICYTVYGICYMVYGVYRLSKMKLTCVTRSWQLVANKTHTHSHTEGGTRSSG